MNYRVEFDPGAEQDLLQAYFWCEARADGLGAEFLKQTKIQEAKLLLNPLIHAIEYADVRRAFLGKFLTACIFGLKRIASGCWPVFTKAATP